MAEYSCYNSFFAVAMTTRREICINQALCRPDHLWGVERELVLMSLLIVVMFVMLAFDVKLTIFAAIFWTLTYQGLRMMAKADPIMSKIYVRHTRFRPFYAVHSTPFCVCNKEYKGWSKR